MNLLTANLNTFPTREFKVTIWSIAVSLCNCANIYPRYMINYRINVLFLLLINLHE